ncbi:MULTISPECIES: DUF4238 domain-containing protein [unclassified Acinetobacter]|uniref:DUF4238 domain-containing protein n=1 Tax=unclassified Acinetobacter TaxID=196816 RepID=UPI0004D9EFF9|nr:MULTISPECIES: DUF4238 domain-containing protein [unclassified Acinetobacter]KEC86336.1 hypothetical protein DT74_00375 [Acinetobacter sp. ETR1]WEE38997.1 DUF4238 domain-containing protein [Acinetobacter sp. TAC-1]
MNDKQNQHFVPQYYFRNFSDDENSIRMLLKKTGKTVENAAIDNQASQDNFYGSRETEKEVTSFDTEYYQLLSQTVLDIKNNTLKNDVLEKIKKAVIFQEYRTLRERENKQPLINFYGEFLQPQIEDLNNYDSGVSSEITDVIRNSLKKALEGMSNQKAQQIFSMFNIESEIIEIEDLKAIFLKNISGTPFIFGDTPVTRFNPALEGTPYDKHGNKHHGLVIHYPINSEISFLIFDSNSYNIQKYKKVFELKNKNDIDQLNKLQIHNSINSVYFKEFKYAQYVKDLWNQEKNNFTTDQPRIECLPEITVDGYLTGRNIQTLIKLEPTYVPKLSFLEIIKISDSKYLPFRSKFIQVLAT